MTRQQPSLAPLLLAIFTRAVPLTMFGPLLPGIARSLGSDLAGIGWIVATYATGSLVAQPVMGRLSDLRGRKRVLMWCLALFGIGSGVCAFATSLPLLVAGRIVQALGAGGIQPVVTAIVADRWPAERRGGALGAVYGMYGVGTMAGALLGGAIVGAAMWLAGQPSFAPALRSELGSFPWHAVFWLNVALAAATVSAVSRLPDDAPQIEAPTTGFDTIGIALVGAFTALVMLAATRTAGDSLFAGVGAALCIVVLVWWERRSRAPLFDPSLFHGRGPILTYVIAFCFGVPSFSLTIYSAAYFIAQFGASAAQAGVALFGLAVAYVAGAVIGGQAGRRAGNRATLIAGLMLTGVSLIALATLTTMPVVSAAMVIGGLGLGLASAPPNALLLGYVEPARAGGASGLAIMLATSGSITAPALVSGFLHHSTQPPGVEFRAAFAAGATLCALCVGIASRLPRGKAPSPSKAGASS